MSSITNLRVGIYSLSGNNHPVENPDSKQALFLDLFHIYWLGIQSCPSLEPESTESTLKCVFFSYWLYYLPKLIHLEWLYSPCTKLNNEREWTEKQIKRSWNFWKNIFCILHGMNDLHSWGYTLSFHFTVVENIIHTNWTFLAESILFNKCYEVIEYTLKKRLVLSLENNFHHLMLPTILVLISLFSQLFFPLF